MTQYSSMRFAAGIPDGIGDIYMEQDRIRDFAWVWDRVGALLADLAGAAATILSGGAVAKGADFTHVNISACLAYAPHTITLGTNNANPPATGTEEITSVRISMPAQSALALTGVTTGTVYDYTGTSQSQVVTNATLDGVTVNYVKLEYAELQGLNRQRLRAAGTWYFTRSPSWRLTIDTT